jgi:hypothetical protein
MGLRVTGCKDVVLVEMALDCLSRLFLLLVLLNFWVLLPKFNVVSHHKT